MGNRSQVQMNLLLNANRFGVKLIAAVWAAQVREKCRCHHDMDGASLK